MLKKIYKGSYGYIKYERIKAVLLTAMMFILAIGIFFLGYLTLGTKKNIWSVVAVLSILPASKSAVRMIMLLRFKPVCIESFEAVEAAKGRVATLYELIVTTTEKSYLVQAASYVDNTLIMYSEIGKKDSRKLLEHLSSSFHKDGISATVKIYDSLDKYILRLKEMNNKLIENENEDYSIFNTLRALSL